MSILSSTMPSSLVFRVERSEPELIPPARPTPYEFKALSDIDDQKALRKHNKGIYFFPNHVGMEGRDPVKVIKEAIAETLVYYYPFAGRLTEGCNDKLVVECSGEGVLFIEAKADVRLDQFGDFLQPPFPGVEDLLYDVPGSDGILHCPLLLIQVTRLMCGGFIFSHRVNHTMCDAIGISQFMTAVGELARGARLPSVEPIWKRELLNARDSPSVSCVHHAYLELQTTKHMALDDISKLVKCSFYFGPEEITALRNHVPPHLQPCSKFNIFTASLWRCRTKALNLNPDDEVRVAFAVNVRSIVDPPLPVGFYGNAVAVPVALSTAGELCQNSLGYALELVKRAKVEVNDEFVRSTADFMVKTNPPRYAIERTFYVSDLTNLGFKDHDFGWGKPIYAGPTWGGQPSSFLIASKKNNGEDGIIVTIDLAEPTMERFAMEIEKMIRVPDNTK